MYSLFESRQRLGKDDRKSVKALDRLSTDSPIYEAPRPTTGVSLAQSNLQTKSFDERLSELRNIQNKFMGMTETPKPQGTPEKKREEIAEEELGVKQKPIDDTIPDFAAKAEEYTKTVNVTLSPDVRADTPFLSGIDRLAKKYSLTKEDLLAVMSFETGGSFNPAQKNIQPNGKSSGATGLIQFIPKTAKSLGTTVEDLAKMNRTEQLVYVEKYLDQFQDKFRGKSARELYLAIFNPSAINKPDSASLYSKGTIAYKQNIGLDKNKDGVITRGEAADSGTRDLGLMKRRDFTIG